jgi:hypothetical protein
MSTKSGVPMRLKLCCAAGLAALFTALAALSPPADAATKKKRVTAPRDEVVVVNRPRTRIRVQQRSFLDPGTEVLPGERKFTDYAFPPGYSPMGTIENTAAYRRSPLPGAFDLPFRNNPYPWNWCVGC